MSGNIILKIIPKVEHPSTLAASSNSVGICFTKDTRIQVPKGIKRLEYIIINPLKVSSKPKALYSLKRGMTLVIGGNIIVARSVIKKKRRPRK